MIEQLENQAAAQLPPVAAAGASATARGVLEGHEVEVRCRVDRQGRRVFTHACAGVRMERKTLLMLTCPEGACEAALGVRRRWLEFTGQTQPSAPRRFAPLRIEPLAEEVPVAVAGHACVARPASFECTTACPVGAHEPRRMRRQGWDLFEGGRYLAGGLVEDEHHHTAAPRFPSLNDAARWLAEAHGSAGRIDVPDGNAA